MPIFIQHTYDVCVCVSMCVFGCGWVSSRVWVRMYMVWATRNSTNCKLTFDDNSHTELINQSQPIADYPTVLIAFVTNSFCIAYAQNRKKWKCSSNNQTMSRSYDDWRISLSKFKWNVFGTLRLQSRTDLSRTEHSSSPSTEQRHTHEILIFFIIIIFVDKFRNKQTQILRVFAKIIK